jgi:NitT/TauT family transport system permease protein
LSIAKRVLFFVPLIVAWEILARRQVWDAAVFPRPIQVAKTLGMLLAGGSLRNGTAVSLRRVPVGYGLSLIDGIPRGVLIDRQPWAEETGDSPEARARPKKQVRRHAESMAIATGLPLRA